MSSAIAVGISDGVHQAQDYSLVVQKKGSPSYRLVRTYLQSGQTAPVLSQSSQSQLIFELPANVINLSRTWLRFDLTQTADAALCNFQAADRLPFQAVRLYTRSGTYLMNIDFNAGQWSRVVRKIRTPMDKFLTLDVNTAQGGADNATGNSARECLCRSNQLASSQASIISGLAAPNNQPFLNYTEPKYVVSTPVGTNLVRTFNINLGACFPETILGMDKDFYFGGQVMLLEFDVEPTNRFSWAATLQTDAVTGQAANSVGAPTVANLWLDLAYQDNVEIAREVKEQFNKGMTIYIPFTQTFRWPTQAGVSFSQPLNLNSGYGRTLKAMTVVFANTNENFGTGQDVTNIAGSKVNSFQSMLDSQLLQPYLVDCQTRFDDYELIKPQVIKSPLAQTRGTYQTTWFWRDLFDGSEPAGEEKSGKPNDNIIGGILLTQENKVYTFTANTANAAFNVYYFALFLKKMVIHPGGAIEIS